MEFYSNNILFTKNYPSNTFRCEQQFKECLNSALENDNLNQASIHLFSAEESTKNTLIEQHSAVTKNTTFPILYHRKQIGFLNLPTHIKERNDDQSPFSLITKKIALLVKRYQANELSNYYLGQNLELIGHSNKILQLESFIEKASNTNYAVVIEGEFGCEKLAVASSIHYSSANKHNPFIEIHCATANFDEFKKSLFQGINDAKKGSIFLSDVDLLGASQQNLLVELLTVNTASKEPHNTIKNKLRNIRLIASSSSPLNIKVKEQQFSQQLYCELNFLTVTFPPLRNRKDDIPYILKNLIKKYKIYTEQELSEEVIAKLCDYDWPENFIQLEHTITRLLTLSSTNPVNLKDLNLYAPEVLATKKHAQIESVITNTHLIDNMLNSKWDNISHLHLKVQKAIKFIAANFTDSISLNDVSEQAFVSPSHISYLFKLHLKKSFKQILAELRIEKAKQLIVLNPHIRITDVSLDVGFGDLSHFEKIFKRYTQLTPRAFKKKQNNNNTLS